MVGQVNVASNVIGRNRSTGFGQNVICRAGAIYKSEKKQSSFRVWEVERWEKGNDFLCYPDI